VALEDRVAADFQRFRYRVGQLLRAGHQPGHDLGIGEEDRVGVDGGKRWLVMPNAVTYGAWVCASRRSA
jgi:hypothetical protein